MVDHTGTECEKTTNTKNKKTKKDQYHILHQRESLGPNLQWQVCMCLVKFYTESYDRNMVGRIWTLIPECKIVGHFHASVRHWEAWWCWRAPPMTSKSTSKHRYNWPPAPDPASTMLRMLLWNSLMLVHAHKQDFYTECIRQHKIQIISFPWALPWIHKIAAWLFFAINPNMSFLRFHSKFEARLILICHLDPATRVGLTEKVGSAVKSLSALTDCHNEATKELWWAARTTVVGSLYQWATIHQCQYQDDAIANTKLMPVPIYQAKSSANTRSQ